LGVAGLSEHGRVGRRAHGTLSIRRAKKLCIRERCPSRAPCHGCARPSPMPLGCTAPAQSLSPSAWRCSAGCELLCCASIIPHGARTTARTATSTRTPAGGQSLRRAFARAGQMRLQRQPATGCRAVACGNAPRSQAASRSGSSSQHAPPLARHGSRFPCPAIGRAVAHAQPRGLLHTASRPRGMTWWISNP
jgi:hypothetical protein